ncbi:putative metabolite transport protein [Glarea lozoyensis 74030]|uniref:Putative metabolite transport protein n=1 Tax=Glarea lozoyensis (strain ATCC 74030 / MF5533) TaxID=1104152 RepID=H0EMC4_GLAL7|nr:putative metabolite transport protein [Glarea lozoyensis 74030]
MSAGRCLSGIGAGAATVIVPIYISEVAPPNERGLFGSMTQVTINIGLLITQTLGFYLSTGSSWRIILGVGIGLGFAQGIGLFFVPESPAWLAAHKDPEQAVKTLQRIRGAGNSIAEEIQHWDVPAGLVDDEAATSLLRDPEAPTRRDSSHSKSSSTKTVEHVGFFAIIKDPQYRPAIIAMIGIMFAQQFCGINSVMMYSVSLLRGVIPMSSSLLTIMISAVNLIATVACSPLADKIGRKTCLLLSIAGMGSSSLVLAISLRMEVKVLSAISVLSFVGFFATGLGPVPFLIASELVGTEAVGATQSWALAANYIFTFLIAQFFPILNTILNEKLGGKGWAYFGFTIFAAISFAFVGAYVPETKGKKDADEVWGRTRRAWLSMHGPRLKWFLVHRPTTRSLTRSTFSLPKSSDQAGERSHLESNSQDPRPKNITSMVKPTVAGVYSATYSNIPVYEYQFGEALKEHAAGFDKPARTRILEREVQKENHEKVQGGYGKYQVAPPARVIEDEYDNQSAQLNDDESIADDVTVASASFMAEDDRYDISQASTGHRKRKREENAQHALNQAHLSYTDELLDYFMTSNLAISAPRPEPPLNFQPDWAIDQDEHTAMHWAASMGDVEVMKQLRKFGANLAAQNVRGETPLMRAVLFTNCKDKQSMPLVVKELIGTAHIVDHCGATVLHHAAASTAQLTKHKPARYYMDVILNKMQEVFEPERTQSILDAQDIDGNTAIHIAAKNCARKIIRALVGRGARTDITNNDGVSAEALIQEINHKTMREFHQGSSSPFAPHENHVSLGSQEVMDQNWPEGFDTPPRQIRRSNAPSHYSEAAMSVEKKIYPLLQEKFGELADSFDEELKEKDTSEQEAHRIVAQVQAELNEIRNRIIDITSTAEDPDTKAEVQAQLNMVEQEMLSLLEQQQQLQLLSRTNREENKANGHASNGDDGLAERAMLSKILASEQEKRRALVSRYRDALGAAGDIGEMGELYRKVIAESMDRVNYDEIDNEIDVILEAMQDEERDGILGPEDE